MRGLLDLDERIEAHVEGLLVGGEDGIPVVKHGLASEDAMIAFAAGYSLLRLETAAAAKLVVEAFQEAQEGQLDGIRQALCQGPSELVSAELQKAAVDAPATIAVAALEALAVHARAQPALNRLARFFSDELPEVRRAAWRINGQLGLARTQTFFEPALREADEGVRGEALRSAAWTQQAWLLPYCRSLAGKPRPENGEAHRLLALLGGPAELQPVLGLGRQAELGPGRFRLLGALGHPGVVEELLRGMENPELRSAVAAGAAFTKMTGCDIESGKRIQLPPEDGHEPDEFEKEFLDEAKLPDAQKAREHWARVKPQFSQASRICRGFDLSRGATPEILNQLDMESRWEACLRGKFHGTWRGTPWDLERFPQAL